MFLGQAPVTSKKDKDEPDEAPPMKLSNGKEQRFKDEKNLKVGLFGLLSVAQNLSADLTLYIWI